MVKMPSHVDDVGHEGHGQVYLRVLDRQESYHGWHAHASKKLADMRATADVRDDMRFSTSQGSVSTVLSPCS